jgi:hypothetical protein
MDLFTGTQYKHNSENKTILLDISGNDLTKTDFLETLENKLILDEEYEVYFESITTFKTKKNTGTNDICFLLKFHDFNIQNGFNYKNNANTLTKLEQKNILIPNSCITDGATAVSKGKKLNFICCLLPIKISEIHLSLTNLDNATIFTANDGRAIIELLCIPKNKKLSEKEKLDLALYEHTNYFDDRNKHLIIDLESTTGDPKAPHLKDFSVDLVEPLIIDRQSDIYLDSTIANKVNDKNDINTNNMGLLLSIDEFDIDNGYNLSTNNKLESHKMLIPNENFIVTILNPLVVTENFSNYINFGLFIGFTILGSSIFNETPEMNGVTIDDAAQYSIPLGGFNSLSGNERTNKYIKFNNGGYRRIKTKNIRSLLSLVSEFKLIFIVGNGTNGGNTPDAPLKIEILNESGIVVTNGTHTIYDVDDATANPGGWQTFTSDSTILNKMKSEGHFIRFSETSTTSNLVHPNYGIKYISIETNTTSTTKITESNKSTKYNYISTVNPKIISKINGSISNLNNASIVDPNEPDCRVVMDFLIKPCL